MMTWVMMWATRTMAVMTLATTLVEGMVGMPAGRGGGLRVEAMAAAAAAAATAAAAAAYCRGHLLFIVKKFLCGIFMMCGEH
jgi:hypothetical protein